MEHTARNSGIDSGGICYTPSRFKRILVQQYKKEIDY